METLDQLTASYKELSQSYVDLERLNLYLLSHHSTAIEGSTLSVIETEIFLEKGLTAQGKPFLDHLMVKDHHDSLLFIIESAKLKQRIDSQFIQNINATVMRSTGTIHNTALGSFDASKGDLRLLNVRAGISGDSYMNYTKVPAYLKSLCTDLERKIGQVKTVKAINELAFLAHYQLLTIHPFVDGNGRTSRLLMNYIQSYHGVPMSIVFTEDRQSYIESLVATRRDEDISIFLNFMESQHLKFLEGEVAKLKNIGEPKQKKSKIISLIF